MEGMLREEERAAGRPRWWGRLAQRVAAAAMAVVMAACGSGGGGGGGTPPAAPTITTAPAAQTVDDGQSASFTVAASGSGLAYQWQRNGSAIAGATAATYTIPAATLADDGASFAVVVSNGGGSATSSAATLTVRPVAPTVTTAPQPATTYEGRTATFSVGASGSAPLAYQWLRGGVEIAGATAASYTTPTLVPGDSGALFSVRVSNGAGSVTSAAAALTVNVLPAAPTIATQPQAQSVAAGQTATFTVDAAGAAPLAYQWQRDGSAIAGATAASYTTPALALSDNGAQFSVVVSDAVGQSVTSAAATLSVTLPPPVAARLSLATTHTLARRADGSVVAWGVNTSGELGSGAVVSGTFARLVGNGAVALVAAEQGGAMRKSGGTVEGWGTNTGGWLGGTNGSSPAVYGTPVSVAWSRPVLEIGFGLDNYDAQDFLFALLDDGSVWHLPGARTFSGSNTSYAAAQVAGLTGASALATGHGPMHVVRNDGTVWKLDFVLNLGTNTYAATPTQVAGLAGATAVTCGVRHCLALLSDGTLRAWGEGRSGELGQGVAASSASPVAVSGLAGVTHIAVTSVYGASFARTADGKLWSWGSGELSAQPGSGALPPADKLVPTEVTSLAGALEVACSDRHCAVRLPDGSVWSWGDDLYQQMGNGPSTLPVWRQVPVKATGINLN